MLDPHGALIYTMVLVSGAERSMPPAELAIIGDIVGHLPVFRDFDRSTLARHLDDCAELLAEEDGLEKTLDAIRQALPQSGRQEAASLPGRFQRCHSPRGHGPGGHGFRSHGSPVVGWGTPPAVPVPRRLRQRPLPHRRAP